MYIPKDDRDKLINVISGIGADALTILQQIDEESNHPPTYCAGYLQGYIHGCDAACDIIDKSTTI